MATNEVFSPGNRVTVTLSGGSAVNSGDICQSNGLHGVAVTDGNTSNEVVLAVVGVYDLSAYSASAISVGTPLYLAGPTNGSNLTTTASTGSYIFGYALETAGSGLLTTMNVLLK